MKLLNKAAAFLCAAAVWAGSFISAEMPAYSDISYAAESYYDNYQYDSAYSAAEKHIADGLFNMDKKISLSKYKLNGDQVVEIFTDILLTRADIFYVQPQVMTYINEGTNTVLYIEPYYYYSQSEVKSRRTKLEKAADTIKSGINSKWNDVQKALYVHDMIIKSAVYDESEDVRTAYEILVKQKGVCVAYAMAYKYILNSIGIDCIVVGSDDMKHSWNMIKIGGSWYHVDLTWDDATPDYYGQVSHDYFMLSDKALKNDENSHYNWDSPYKADSKKYDSRFWKDSNSFIVPYSSRYWYYINNDKGQLRRYDWKTGRSAKIMSIDKDWKYDNAYTWDYCFSRLEKDGNDILISTDNEILRYNVKKKQLSVVKRVKPSGIDCIYGMTKKDGKLTYQLSEYEASPDIKAYVIK